MSSSNTDSSRRPPLPPFTNETALLKIRLAEDAWNTQDPDKVKMAYSINTIWRNRSTFLQGRDAVRDFLADKWRREQDYRLIKELWAYSDNKIAVRYCYEYRRPNNNNDHGPQQWFRAYGNENWEFDANGFMTHRYASINDVPIAESERKFHWPQGQRRPDDHPGLSELGL